MKAKDRIKKSRNQLIVYWCATVLFLGIGTGLYFLSATLGLCILVFSGICLFVAVGTTVSEVKMQQAFAEMSVSEDVPFAFVNEYGHLELFAGERENAEKYISFSFKTFTKLYRPVDDRPTPRGTVDKNAKKQLLAEEKMLTLELFPIRQFNDCTPADLAMLRHKVIFVSKRMYRIIASEGAWEEARSFGNTVLVQDGPKWK